jgi:hypothetical protein
MQDAEQSLAVIEYHGIHTLLILRHVLIRRCLSLVHGNTKCVMLVDVTWTLIFYITGAASSWHRNRKVCCTCECTSHLWYHNRSCGKRAVENSRGVVQKLRTSQMGVLEVRRECRLFSYQFSRVDPLSRNDRPMGKHFGNGNDIDTAFEWAVCTQNLWTDGACCRCEEVLNIRSSHLEARDIVCTMPERGRQMLFIVSVGARIVKDVVLLPCMLRVHDRFQQDREF